MHATEHAEGLAAHIAVGLAPAASSGAGSCRISSGGVCIDKRVHIQRHLRQRRCDVTHAV